MASTAPSNALLSPPAGYIPPGVYIGEAYTSTSSVAPEVRVATFIGKGSRYIRTPNQKILRGYIYDTPLQFSTTSPHYAALAVPSNGIQGSDSLVDGNGNVVRQDLWLFANSGTAVQISDSIYDPTQTYFFSYQGASYTTPDPIPASDIRVIEAVGNQVSQNSYVRNTDYYIDEVILPPTPAMNNGIVVQHTNAVPVFSAISHTGTGTATVSYDSSSTFQHNYGRSYLLTITNVTGAVVTFSWTATPTSFGNATQPSVPFAPSLTAPTFSINTANAQTLTQALELGIRLDFTASGTYVLADTYTFSVTGPSVVEVDSAYTNTNQFAATSVVVPGIANTGAGTLYVNGSQFTGSHNVNFVLQVTNVDTGVTAAAVPSGSVLFAGNPVNGESISLTNGYTGTSNVTKGFEFNTTGVSQSIPGSISVVSATVAAVAATGVIYFNGSVSQAPADGDTVTITDGIKTLVFEFDANGILYNSTAIKVLVDTTPSSQSQNTAANLVTAINANFTTITATNASGSHSGIGWVTLAVGVAGTAGNNVIVTSDPTFIKVSGFTGGANVAANVPGTIANFIAAVNTATNPRLGMVAYQDTNNANQVDLIYGSQFVFTGIPANNDTAIVTVGGVATTFTFQTSVALSHGVLIGLSVAATIASFVTVINAVSGLVAVSSVFGGINTVTVASTLHRSLVLTHPVGTAIGSVVGDVIVGSASSNGNNAITSTGYTNGAISNVAYSGFTGGVPAGSAPDVLTLAWGTSGDVFTGGTLYIKDTAAGSAIVSLYQGVTVQVTALASYATGSITLNVNPANSDTVTINDHVLGSTIFTFKTSATLTNDVQIATTAALTAANLLAKIQLVGLSLVATLTGSTVSLKHTLTGSAYNGAITFSSTALTVTGLAGGATNYGVGDTFSFTAETPRKFVTALDTRSVRLTTGVVGVNTSTLVDPKYINFSFYANTPEGGFGTVQSYGSGNGYFVLPGQIGLVARNQTSFVQGDAFDVELVNNNVIYWTLSATSTEVFSAGTVLQDRNGAITGTVGSYYIVLRSQPFAGTITASLSGSPFTLFTPIANTSILVLGIANTAAITTLSVTYTHRGNQPSLGGSYYLSAQYVRPLSAYNVPFVFYDPASATAFLDPVTVANDLAIANMIAWNQAPSPQAVAFIQIHDTDGDGVFSPTDVDKALAGAIGVSYITDVVGVNQPNYMDKFLTYNINASDPFAKKEQLQYFGLASGSAIGDQITQGTLIYTATNTLQVYGASPAHGTRVLVGSTTAQMQVTQYDGSVVTATLDGSFIAVAIASLVAGLPNNSTDILRMNISGFSYMETFNDTQNDLLGGASILWFRPNGANMYQIMEDVTVDLTSGSGSDYQLILAMKTKQDSVKQMRDQLDRQLIGYVADTKAAGIGFVSSAIMSELLSQVGSGVIAPYQDASGNARSVSPSDIQVIQDASDPTLYHFRYLIFTKTPIKRLYGTYSVNQSAFIGSL